MASLRVSIAAEEARKSETSARRKTKKDAKPSKWAKKFKLREAGLLEEKPARPRRNEGRAKPLSDGYSLAGSLPDSIDVAAVEVSNSCIATAPRRRRNKPKTSHGAGRLRHPINTGRRRESCRDITENEGQAQNDTKEEARITTKGQNYERGAHPSSPGGRRALGGLHIKAPAGGTSTTADDGRQDAVVDVSAPY